MGEQVGFCGQAGSWEGRRGAPGAAGGGYNCRGETGAGKTGALVWEQVQPVKRWRQGLEGAGDG